MDDGGSVQAPRPDALDRWVGAVLVAAIAIPLVAAGLRMAGAGFVPTADDSVITSRALDVLTRHNPVVGQYSLAGGTGSAPARSLGPMLYWLLAVPARIGPGWVLPLWMAVVNGACLAGSVLLAARRGGRLFAWATAIGLCFVVRALSPSILVEVWNPWATQAALVAATFLAWSVAAGDRRLLPLVVVTTSFVVQSHFTYAVPGLLLGLVALVGGWGPAAWVRLRGRGPSTGEDAPSARWWVRVTHHPLLLATGTAVVCWAAPLYDQLTGHPGNLTRASQAASSDGPKLGVDAVAASISRAIGLPPQFLRATPDPAQVIKEGIGSPPALAAATAVLVLAGLAIAGFVALARRDRSTATGVATAVALLIGLTFVSGRMPADGVLPAAYSFRWFVFAGLFVWLITGLGLVRAFVPEAARRPRRLPLGARVALGLVLAAAVVMAASAPMHDPTAWTYRPSAELADALGEATVPGGRYLVVDAGPYGVAIAPALALHLRETGRHPVLDSHALQAFGDRYAPDGTPCDGEVVLQRQSDPIPPGGEVVAELVLPPDTPIERPMRMVLIPAEVSTATC